MNIGQAAVETVRETTAVVTPNLYTFVATIAEMAAEGWLLDLDNNPPITLGILYEAGMYRDVEAPAETPVKIPVDRAAIMAKARAAKGKKEVA